MDHASDETKKVGEALAWIVGVLERHGVPYQVVGGLAARAHGAERPIVDVDLYVPFDQAQSALEEIRPNVVWGPQHHAGDEWDLTFLKADHGGQRVDYDAGVRVELLGVRAWVMPEEELVRYKRILGRPVDLDDVAQIAKRRRVGE